jgi:hypothetical protein
MLRIVFIWAYMTNEMPLRTYPVASMLQRLIISYLDINAHSS